MKSKIKKILLVKFYKNFCKKNGAQHIISCLIKTGIMKMYGIGFFVIFFESLSLKKSIFSKTTPTIFKKVVPMQISPTIPCACIIQQSLFTLHKFVRLSKKCVRTISDLSFFLHFLKNYRPKSKILISTERTCCGKHFCISGYALFFLHKK